MPNFPPSSVFVCVSVCVCLYSSSLCVFDGRTVSSVGVVSVSFVASASAISNGRLLFFALPPERH